MMYHRRLTVLSADKSHRIRFSADVACNVSAFFLGVEQLVLVEIICDSADVKHFKVCHEQL